MSNIHIGTEYSQVRPGVKRPIRQVRVLAVDKVRQSVTVVALNGPLAGEEYTVSPEVLR